ncbi:MAG TPA: hypothetical protein VFB63_16045 [Bryobacteraceae bacterium]|jgi:predicted nucleotidyltransferase|nr:hypothetical protein [Bryobacteraceae bacterium]
MRKGKESSRKSSGAGEQSLVLTKDSREFIELLNSNGVEYMIVGGYAVSHYTKPRFTDDIDFLIRPTVENARRMEFVIREFGFASLGLGASDFEKEDQIIQLGHPPERIDIATSISGVETEAVWASRQEAELDGIRVWYIDRESLKRNKRAVARHIDRADLKRLG